ncbi:MAG TPA: benzoyl-CoA 2,3-epoxidase subunit BoxB [Polyangiaceae bacterium]|nr:benzoyl-CoA 2,3-epoxidase subunit BoxB [Polyangiaceae bacterium]
MSEVNQDKIPNNVHLSDDKKLQRALEAWQPNYIKWWREMGPSGFQEDDVFLRTATSVDHEGWAHFEYVKMPDYRWGIFLADQIPDRTIACGDDYGKPVWHQVPGEHRNTLQRLIVTQGDTEPASVEQQRLLGHSCPSVYDLRNLFQVNVEEGRHLWAMVYLLQSYFGRDGREQAEELLQRRSGDPDKPRMLGAFNEPCTDWLSFFMFTYFTDRDGKYQLLALSESAFDPLSRSTRFMLTEEAHHMFVGETGVQRIAERTAKMMVEKKVEAPDQVRKLGLIDLPTMQKYLNLWFSLSLDLFGGEVSSNAANYFGFGIKGRAKEASYPDHIALTGTHGVEEFKDGKLVHTEVPLRNAMNEVLRDEYVEDCQRGVDKWNRTIAQAGIKFEFKLPHRRFHRHVGLYQNAFFDPEGTPISKEEFEKKKADWLPTDEDKTYVRGLMTKPIYDPKQMANWIAPPKIGIKGKPVDFEYVHVRHAD